MSVKTWRECEDMTRRVRVSVTRRGALEPALDDVGRRAMKMQEAKAGGGKRRKRQRSRLGEELATAHRAQATPPRYRSNESMLARRRGRRWARQHAATVFDDSMLLLSSPYNHLALSTHAHTVTL